MKIICAIDDAHSINENEVNCFLERKLNLQLAKNDETDDPNIQPIGLNMWIWQWQEEALFYDS